MGDGKVPAAHDPSVREDADTSPEDGGGKPYSGTVS